MALDVPLPKQVFGHPWLLQGDGKMSKSKGNVIYADDLVKFFGVDAVRYFVLHEMPFENDGVITWELLVERMNSDLANTLGNLVNRTISMSNKYFGGVVTNTNVCEPVDEELKAVVLGASAKVQAKMEELRVADAMTEVFSVFKRCNKYIDETMPWALAKDEAKADRLKTVLYNLVESIRFIGILIGPFMPETGEKILAQINAAAKEYESLCAFNEDAAIKVGEATPLFARLDEAKKLEEVEKDIFAPKEEPKKEEPKEETNEITIDDFAKVEMKVGLVLESKPVEGADKLLVSQVKIGDEVRQIVSGIAKYYKPEEMVGKKVVVVTNLKPVKLRGVLSQGMILAAVDGDTLSIVSPEKIDKIGDGTKIS